MEAAEAGANAEAEANQRRRTQTIVWGVALGVYWVTLFLATHVPTPELIQGAMELNGDKLIHVSAYFVLTTLAFGFVRSAGWTTVLGLPVAAGLLVGLIGYGVLDEVTQPLVNRVCDPLDLLGDAVGVSLGVWVNRWWYGPVAV